MADKKDRVLILLSALGTAGFFLLPLVEAKPNRIVSGEKLLALEYLGVLGALIIMGWGCREIAPFEKTAHSEERVLFFYQKKKKDG